MFSDTTNILAALVIGVAAIGVVDRADPAPAEIGPTPAVAADAAKSILLSCEVYRIDGDELSSAVEAATSTTANDTDAVAKILKGASSGATRLARIHAPMEINREISFTNTKQVPTTTVNQGQFSSQTSFSGYQKASTRLGFMAAKDDDGFTTNFSIQIEAFSSGKDGNRTTPPPRDQMTIDGSVSAPSGVTRMYQLNAGVNSSSMTVVFITATTL